MFDELLKETGHAASKYRIVLYLGERLTNPIQIGFFGFPRPGGGGGIPSAPPSVTPRIERLRFAFPANGKRQKCPRDHNFSSFAVYRLPFLSEGKLFRVSHKHENYFALFSYTYHLF